jgi:translation elongation factor EF-1beta
VQLLEFILRVKQLLLQYPPAAGTWHLLPSLRQHPLLPQLRQHQPQRCVPEVLSLKSAISCHYDVQIPIVLLHFCTQTIFLGGFDVQADDDDLDLFGEETEEEAAAAAEREASKKAAGAKKKESGKSSVLLDVKPWDDETDMKKLEECVRSVSMQGLFWGASKLVQVVAGIKKLQIMMTIVDDEVSVDNLIEDYLTSEPNNEYIQSCDIVAFNKI